jgi:hypothetical protein
MGGLQKMIGGFVSTAGVIGIATAAIGFLVTQMREMEQAAVESAKADAKLEAVLRSTGGAVGLTSEELNKLANETAHMAGLDDELVKSSEAVLLTFTRIGQETFPETMRAAADMSAVLGTDLQGSVIQIGKAMNDFSGYTALKRAGVSFTKEQIEQIKNFKETNDLVGYQNLVLAELKREFGGAAEAINDAGDGSENMNTAVGNLREAIGEGLIPQQRAWNNLIEETANGLTELVEVNNDLTSSLDALGIVRVRGAIYIKDGIRYTKEEVDAMLAAAQAGKEAEEGYVGMARGIKDVGDAASLTDEQLKELSDTNKDMISTTEKFTDMTKLSAEEHQAATRKIILGMLEQKLSIDGLDEKETNFLLEQGVKWGVYSDTAVEEMRAAMAEVNKLAGAVNGIPNKTVYVDVVTRQYSEDYRSRGIEGGLIGRGYANGADFIVPPGFQNDSYPMRVQSGERVQVTPAGKQEGPDMSELLREIKRLPGAISTSMRDTYLRGAQ